MAESKVATLIGKDLADDYVRTNVPKSRWSDTWEIFKINVSKIVIINAFMLLFLIPSIAIVYFSNVYVLNMGSIYPFAANSGIYPFAPSTQGLAEQIKLNSDVMFYALFVLSGFIASVGISGAAYSLKKLINTRGEFNIKGFFHGVKVSYFNTLLAVMIFLIFFFGTVLISDWCNLFIATGANKVGYTIAKIFSIIVTSVAGLYCAWLLSVGVSYKVQLKHLFKNAFILLFGSVLQSVIMGAFALLPVWIALLFAKSQFLNMLVIMMFIFFGFALIVLIWTAYTQWVFDMFITPALKKEKEVEREKMTPKQREEAQAEEERELARELLAAGKSELIGKPIKPIEQTDRVGVIGSTFTRADVKKAQTERAQINSNVVSYYDEHKNEPRYVEYNKLFAEREKPVEVTDKKNKKKKVDSGNLLK